MRDRLRKRLQDALIRCGAKPHPLNPIHVFMYSPSTVLDAGRWCSCTDNFTISVPYASYGYTTAPGEPLTYTIFTLTSQIEAGEETAVHTDLQQVLVLSLDSIILGVFKSFG